jgi:thioredoxin reductase (NADPH)
MSLKNLGAESVKLPFDPEKLYDVVVIGGGSAGISFATEARELGLSVALFDYVDPSNQGSTWGLGGTCVNVGCIPKKLFHIASMVEEEAHLRQSYGWQVNNETTQHNWSVLRDNIQNYIKGLNFGYISKMKEVGVDYVNAFARFENKNEVGFIFKGKDYKIHAKNFVVAAGGRPRDYPGVPDLAKHAITSDDLFNLDRDPGKTLVVGGGYIAVECAGFLNGLGKEVTLINRSVFLRVMDDDMAFRIIDDMEMHGVEALRKTVPVSVTKVGEKYQVVLKVDGVERTVDYDTVLVAIGRDPAPERMGLDKIGVELARSGKVQGREGEMERSNHDHIYALGDILEGVPELQTVAAKSGRILANRIAARLKSAEESVIEKFATDYRHIPTTVFSPTEYSFVGPTEAEAIAEHGEDGIEVYHREVTPLQYELVTNNLKSAYMKVICDKSDGERVLAIHYVGPEAAEVIAGYALAMKLGLRKADLDAAMGVHPSTSEDLFTLDITKRSGKDFRKTGC